MSARRRQRGLALVLLVSFLASLIPLSAARTFSAGPVQHPTTPERSSPALSAPRPTVAPALQHDELPALRTIQAKAVPPAPAGAAPRLQPLVRLPQDAAEQFDPSLSAAADPAVQSQQGGVAMPGPGRSFDGVSNLHHLVPPNSSGAVGPDHYMQWVNLSFAIWDKSGSLLYGPTPGNALWSGFGGVCETRNDGDPIVLYDHLAGRWMVSQFAINFPSDFHQCIAVSKSSDPTGGWYRYDFQISDAKMNDYPKFGVWPDGYYMSMNQFDGSTKTWAGAGVVVFEREKMLAGQQARRISFDLDSVDRKFAGLLPADLDGAPPPPGTPSYFMQFQDDSNGFRQDQLALWEFAVDWAHPAGSTFGVDGRPSRVLPTEPFDSNLCDYNVSCIPQPETSTALDALSDRLMYRLQYRNFGTHQSMVVNHTVDASGGDQAGLRWYELRNSGVGWDIYQQSTYAPDAAHRWMGSIGLDSSGNMALGYTVSGRSTFPSIRYAGRLEGDSLNRLTQAETTLLEGSGSQTNSSRWGDYSTLAVDPSDGCTFWYTSQYYPASSPSAWRTRIGSFKFPSCSSAPSGALTGVVTDVADGEPIPGATVHAGAYSTITDDSGGYRFLDLPVGSYAVSVSAFGYGSETASDVAVSENASFRQDFALSSRPRVLVEGTVSDGAGQGWPLYARIDIKGYKGVPIFTDPLSGRYSVELLESATYTFTISAMYPGYQPVQRVVTTATAGKTENFALSLADGCRAPGYRLSGAKLLERFDSGAKPPGWTVVDNLMNGQDWAFNNPGTRENHTGGSGPFAIVDSDKMKGIQDTELRTPELDLSGLSQAFIEFDTDFRWYEEQSAEVADVDVSTDGGASWTNVWRRSGDSYRGPRRERIDITTVAAGESRVMVRFRYYNAEYEYWWQVDDVLIGDPQCIPSAGSLVVGNVYDAQTGDALNAASVSYAAGSTLSAATPEDPALDDGFFHLFAEPGAHIFTAEKLAYGRDMQSVELADSAVVTRTFSLLNDIVALPRSITVSVVRGRAMTETLALSSTGDVLRNFNVYEVAAPARAARPGGPYAPDSRRLSPKHLHEPTAEYVHDYSPPPATELAAGHVLRSWSSGLTGAWGVGFDARTQAIWVSNPTASGGDGRSYRFRRDGRLSGDTLNNAWAVGFAADMAYSPFTGTFWHVQAGGDSCIYEIDPAGLGVTGRKLCPAFGTSERGLAFDPASGTFYAGSWNDGVINHFDMSGTLLDAKYVGLNVSGLAFNPATGHLFAMTNARSGYDVYVLDTRDNYAIVGGFDIAGMDSYEQAGMEMDCSGHLWVVNQKTGKIAEVTSGERGSCAWSDIPWLNPGPTSGTTSAGRVQELRLTFDTGGLAFGVYRAHLRVENDSGGGTTIIPVNLVVRRAAYLPFAAH